MKQINFKTEKTARYFTLGTLSSKTKNIWIVCHGYAQLANHFLKWFESIDSEENVIIAPEALHRFYWKGFDGKVVASWMTKEDRLNDIADYVNYLDQVTLSILQHVNRKTIKLNVLGFSQGGATVCRWVTQSNLNFDSLTLWAGAFPEDIDYFEERDFFNTLNLHLVIGDEDPFYSKERVAKQTQLLADKDINYTLIRFQGNHKVLPIPLKELEESLKNS
ncbi:MAG: alpha/beta hydrolase [Flavobacteriales bacterium]|jgi:predicted esterase|nr:alpha/beta hydrolase [Flavobacteriales bacterium]